MTTADAQFWKDKFEKLEKLYDEMCLTLANQRLRDHIQLRKQYQVAQVQCHYGDNFELLPIIDTHQGAHGVIVTVGRPEMADK